MRTADRFRLCRIIVSVRQPILDGHSLDPDDPRLALVVDVDAHGIPRLEPDPLEFLYNSVVVVRSPENRPHGVSNGIDAVGVMSAKIDPKLVFGDEGVRFGKKNVDFVQAVSYTHLTLPTN